MKNVLILHGTNGNHESNWFQWLENEFTQKGYKVWVPDLPYAEKPNTERYNHQIFLNWKFDSDSIIIGHSSGAVAILGLLQSLPSEIAIKKAILVAGFTDDLGWDPLKELFIKPFDYKKIKTKAKEIILFHSDNDPYVSLSHGNKLKELLGAKLIILPGQGHFNLEAGRRYKQFPELLKYL